VSEKKQQQSHGALIWGIILLFLGIVFLLQALDVLPWALWVALWRFWPLLIIIIGLNILLSRQNLWLVGALVLVLLGASLGVAIWQYDQASETGIKSYSEPLADLERASIVIDFDGGSLSLGSLAYDSSNLVEVASKSKGGDGGIEADFHRQNGEGSLHLSSKGVNRVFWSGPLVDWEAMFTQNIPLTLHIKSAASSISLDLSKLLSSEVLVELNAGNCKVTTPSSAGTTYIKIDANVSNIEVTIPTGVAAKIQLDTNVTNIDVDRSRFPQSGDYYMSEDFVTSGKQVELKIKCNVGSVQVK